jgi:hypothetical protein
VNPETRTPQNGFDFYDLSLRKPHDPGHDKKHNIVDYFHLLSQRSCETRSK